MMQNSLVKFDRPMPEPQSEQTPDRPILSVFDFDGTLSVHDSFIPFLRFVLGNDVFALKLLSMTGPALNYLWRRLGRDELKARLIQRCLQGLSEQALQQQAHDYCEKVWPRLLRPKGLQEVARQRETAAHVTLCSASPEIMLAPFAQRLGIGLIGTRLEVQQGRLTGQLIGRNCRREEKIARLEKAYGGLDQYHLRAWGDSLGDKEMLARADEAFWKPFR